MMIPNLRSRSGLAVVATSGGGRESLVSGCAGDGGLLSEPLGRPGVSARPASVLENRR